MVVDDLFGVIHAAVTDLDCVTIKDFLSLWSFGVSDIGADVFAEWGVVPEYVVPLSIFFRLLVVGGS